MQIAQRLKEEITKWRITNLEKLYLKTLVVLAIATETQLREGKMTTALAVGGLSFYCF